MAINTHILPDNKFNTHFAKSCLKYGVIEDRFISIPRDDNGPKFPVNGISYLDTLEDVLDNLNSEETRRIYIHGLWGWRSELLDQIDVSTPITWVLYGVGAYKRLPFYKIYETRTRPLKYFGREKMGLLDWARFLRSCKPRLGQYLETRRNLQKLDSMAFWLRHDYDKIRRFYQLDVDYINFGYGSTPTPTAVRINVMREIRSLLLGNSADPSNNHVDALYELQGVGFDGRIVCPLSYSGCKDYTDHVIQVGERLFGERFEPLQSYMDKSRYFELLDGLDAAYFYHRRQQAGGNVSFFLSRGKPVFLHPVSPLLRYYRNLGVPIVYPTDRFDARREMSRKQVQAAIKALEKRNLEEAISKRYHNLLTYGMTAKATNVIN